MLIGLKCKVGHKNTKGHTRIDYEGTIVSTPQIVPEGDFYVVVLNKENRLSVVDIQYIIEVIHV